MSERSEQNLLLSVPFGREHLADAPTVEHTRDLPADVPTAIGQLVDRRPQLGLGGCRGNRSFVRPGLPIIAK